MQLLTGHSVIISKYVCGSWTQIHSHNVGGSTFFCCQSCLLNWKKKSSLPGSMKSGGQMNLFYVEEVSSKNVINRCNYAFWCKVLQADSGETYSGAPRPQAANSLTTLFINAGLQFNPASFEYLLPIKGPILQLPPALFGVKTPLCAHVVLK